MRVSDYFNKNISNQCVAESKLSEVVKNSKELTINDKNVQSAVRTLESTKYSKMMEKVLQIANFVIKFFNKKFELFDRVLHVNDHIGSLLSTIYQIKQIDIAKELKLSDLLIFDKGFLLEDVTAHRLKSISSQQDTKHLIEFSNSLHSETDHESMKNSYKQLPDHLRKLLEGVYRRESEAPENLRDNPKALLNFHNEKGEDVVEQLIRILARCDEVSYLMSQILLGDISAEKKDPIQNELEMIKQTLNNLREGKECASYLTDVDFLSEAKRADAILSQPISTTIVAVEFSGLAKVGGLAEAVEGLAKGLKKENSDNKVRVIFPEYKCFSADIKKEIENATTKTMMTSAGTPITFTTLEINGVEVVFLRDDVFDVKEHPYEGNIGERFAKFSALAADWIYEKKNDIGIIHLHDWHSAGVLLKLYNDHENDWREGVIPPCVFTFHNHSRIAQGRLDNGAYCYTGVNQAFQRLNVASKGDNLLLDAVKLADHVTTVSSTFAKEAQNIGTGEGVSFAIRAAAKAHKLTGVINGANPDRWNPETDHNLKGWKDIATGEACDLSYGPDNDNIMTKKLRNKEQLDLWLKKHFPGKSIDVNKPIITYVGRFDMYQKGLDKLEEAIKTTLEEGGQFISMGAFESSDATALLDHLEKEYENNPSVIFIRDYKENNRYYYQQGDLNQGRPGIGSVVRAASDFVFIPSRFEPCGLVQFESWLFGAQVIASNVGGLADTVIPRERDAEHHNGYVFSRDKGGSLQHNIKKALLDYKQMNTDKLKGLTQRLIEDGRKCSWTTAPRGLSPVEQYRLVYANAAERVRRGRSTNKFCNLGLGQGMHNHAYESAEERYLKAYSEGVPQKQLLELYQKVHKSQREQLPIPHSRGVEADGYKTYGAHYANGEVRFKMAAPKAKVVELEIKDASGRVEIKNLERDENGNDWSVTIKLPPGTRYRYHITNKNKQVKIDPYAFEMEYPAVWKEGGDNVPWSIVKDSSAHTWKDKEWLSARKEFDYATSPVSIYEVHPASFSKVDGKPLNYRKLGKRLIEKCKTDGFTHVELMGLAEHPMDESWGYQSTGYFAPCSRLGRAEDFKAMIDELHRNKVGIIMDWVPAHFAIDDYALKEFDGAPQYERSGFFYNLSVQKKVFSWGCKHFDLSKPEVREFLLSSALFWIKEMHVDILRVDAISSMLYSTNPKDSELFLRQLNTIIAQRSGGAVAIAEDYSGRSDMMMSPAKDNGLGFAAKWNVGWKQNCNLYFSTPLSERPNNYQHLVNAVDSCGDQAQVLAWSHDEMKHGGAVPVHHQRGLSSAQQLAQSKAFLGLQWGLPGKKLIMMGMEKGVGGSWDLAGKEDTGVLDQDTRFNKNGQYLEKTVAKLNDVYKKNLVLQEQMPGSNNIEWIKNDDPKKQVIGYRRIGANGQRVAVFHNFTNAKVPAIQVKIANRFSPKEIFNSDSYTLGGKGRVNRAISVTNNLYNVTVPPLSTVIIEEGYGSEGVPAPTPINNCQPSRLDKCKRTVQRVAQIVKKVTQLIFSVLSWPFRMGRRYLGSKDWSFLGATIRLCKVGCQRLLRQKVTTVITPGFSETGYMRHPEKTLSKEEVKPYLLYAAKATAVHRGDMSWLENSSERLISPKELGVPPGELKRRGNVLFNPKSGLKCMITENDSDVTITFRALNSQKSALKPAEGSGSCSERNLKYNIGSSLLGYKSNLYEEADEIVDFLKENPRFAGKKISICGSCLGGSLAQYAAFRHSLPAYCFNMLAMGAGLQEDIGLEQLRKHAPNVHHVMIEKDFVGANGLLGGGDQIASFLGVRTPGNFGRRFIVPTPYKKGKEIHERVLASLIYRATGKLCEKREEVSAIWKEVS